MMLIKQILMLKKVRFYVKYLHPYCKANILSYCSVNINIGIGEMCIDISVSDRIGYLPYQWITSVNEGID